jgi:hypothetical protein
MNTTQSDPDVMMVEFPLIQAKETPARAPSSRGYGNYGSCWLVAVGLDHACGAGSD